MSKLKLYTKSGDEGFTSLSDGKRIEKSSDLIELYGSLDELCVCLGYVIESLVHKENFTDLLKRFYELQKELFGIGTHLSPSHKFAINPHKIGKLEVEIDAMSEKLPVLKSFILPGGGECALRIHMARVVCRRAERTAYKIAKSQGNIEVVGIYLNRLSDWLYAAARTAAMLDNIEEIVVN